jgi:hypothetical protein
MDVVKPSNDAPVYMSTPGATLYRHICINCHGPNADGKGLQADALGAASEGEARPANFREGLFGPSTKPGANLTEAFSMAGTPTDALNWAARYMAWMALGGTLKRIPQDIIHQVEATKILGEPRRHLDQLPGASEASANMLNLARGLCSVILPDPTGNFAPDPFAAGLTEPQVYPPFMSADTPFIATNGDREMWLYLCSHFSPPVVRVYGVDANTTNVVLVALYPGESYPTTAPVLDHKKVVQTGIKPDNYYPTCFKYPTDAAQLAWLADHNVVQSKTKMPNCPADFLAKTTPMWTITAGSEEIVKTQQNNIIRWTLRGAAATGMAVFSYLQGGGAQNAVTPYYDQCQLLP